MIKFAREVSLPKWTSNAYTTTEPNNSSETTTYRNQAVALKSRIAFSDINVSVVDQSRGGAGKRIKLINIMNEVS